MTKEVIDQHESRFLAELFEWLRIPSISTNPAHKPDILRAAEFVAERLREAGADAVELCPTPGNPIVYGEKILGPNLPTVLVYGHYDVQPPDPLDLWHSPPFEPTLRDGKIYARGACDDKGQTYMHVKAFELMMLENKLPCNVKFMIEGEEEIGSVNLESFVRANLQKLSCDVVLISDTGMISNEVPSVTVGLRGLSYMEVEVTGPNRDLHSGLYGGAVANPINALATMIASLKDANGHITIPGFYDDVVELTAQERSAMAEAPFSLEEFKQSIGLTDIYGETGYTTPERTSIRPTLDVNGIWGGYMGEGAKTVIPSKAYAKISMRLVPNQHSERISDLFARHFESIAPQGVTVKVSYHHGGQPVVTPSDSPSFRAASAAYERTFGRKPVPVRSGGSIPIVEMFRRVLGVDSAMMGFGLDSDAIHSPNEHFGVFNYKKGIETIPWFYTFFAEEAKK